jgi:23S rRNA (adenine2030-N6)-methyltransferase
VPDYSHRRHAGNVGDVWKHCVLVAMLARASGRVAYLDTHAGEGTYPLLPTGEWAEGIGRLWTAQSDDGAVAAYLGHCRRLARGGGRPETYPGSPAMARAVLGSEAPLVLYERDAEAFERLDAAFSRDPHVRLVHGDGLAALAAELPALASAHGGAVALIDPPYSQKADWARVPDAVARAAAAAERACLLLWYPVKSLTRPNAMVARLRAAGIAGALAELVTTPLEHQRNRLNGSGVIVVRPPEGALEAIAAAAPPIGGRCATREDAWSFRMVRW